MHNKCKWTPKALDDLYLIEQYIAEENPQASVDLTKKIILTVVEQLSKFQNIGRAGRVYGTRELIVTKTPYIAVYKVRQDTVEVVRVLHSSMQWPDNF